MSDALSTYLHDHLAGSHFAVNLLNSLHEQYKDEELGQFALTLCAEIRRDQQALQEIVDHVGKAPVDLTELAGWLAEKASQFKLQRDHARGGIGTFEAIEALLLGVRGKLALWEALPRIRQYDKRVPDRDFGQLAVRADAQQAQLEARRLQLVQPTFAPAST